MTSTNPYQSPGILARGLIRASVQYKWPRLLGILIVLLFANSKLVPQPILDAQLPPLAILGFVISQAVLALALFVIVIEWTMRRRVKLVVDDDGLRYEDFIQEIEAPWESIRSVEPRTFIGLHSVRTQPCSVSFDLHRSHPMASQLLEIVQQRQADNS
jgi:hypothetical protein